MGARTGSTTGSATTGTNSASASGQCFTMCPGCRQRKQVRTCRLLSRRSPRPARRLPADHQDDVVAGSAASRRHGAAP
eukprot:12910588-Prorocentrum_lima.AAC.1